MNWRNEQVAPEQHECRNVAAHEGSPTMAQVSPIERLHVGAWIVENRNVNLQSPKQVRQMAPVDCVQRHFALLHRDHDGMVDGFADSGVAYVSFSSPVRWVHAALVFPRHSGELSSSESIPSASGSGFEGGFLMHPSTKSSFLA